MNKQFTPGPWRENGKTITKSDGLKIIVKSPAGAAPEAWDEIHQKLKFDACLIAAAPEMFDELERLAQELDLDHPTQSRIYDLLERITQH